ncbi:hypothetical protein N9B38_03005 [bacterium]|nr:hypothetical protein [bacterium]
MEYRIAVAVLQMKRPTVAPLLLCVTQRQVFLNLYLVNWSRTSVQVCIAAFLDLTYAMLGL